MSQKQTIDEVDGKLRIRDYAAGNLVNETIFDVSVERFMTALDALFASDEKEKSVDLPGRTMELSALEDGVRISVWRTKNPTRTTQKIAWRNMARFLVAH